jgi:hypothetical protein
LKLSNPIEYLSNPGAAWPGAITTPDIEELESIWAGGIADFGDPEAAVVITRVPGYYRYKRSLIRSLGAAPMPMYRTMPQDDAETLISGTGIGPKGFTFREDVARAWGRFAGHAQGPLVVIRAQVPADAVIMRGKREEAELVINTSHLDGSQIEIL